MAEYTPNTKTWNGGIYHQTLKHGMAEYTPQTLKHGMAEYIAKHKNMEWQNITPNTKTWNGRI